MFDAYPSYSPYRAMRLAAPQMMGQDIYALQLALNEIGKFDVPLQPDGVFGVKTGKAVVSVQKKLGVGSDGVAGGVTQRAMVTKFAAETARVRALPTGLPYGQIAHESSCLFGNYSAPRSDGSYDAGVCQRNTSYTPPKEGFDPIKSVSALGKDERASFELYQGVTPARRRWELACGHWNAPAFANYIAREEGAKGVSGMLTARPTATARETLEAYMASATAYLKLE
jgi:peptidoglycan hydrolase-like protein with peptidoglycan-binding domain